MEAGFLAIYFALNGIGLLVSVLLVAPAVARAQRRALALSGFVVALAVTGAAYVRVIGPWTKTALPLFTGEAASPYGWLLVHSLIPTALWVACGVVVRRVLHWRAIGK